MPPNDANGQTSAVLTLRLGRTEPALYVLPDIGGNLIYARNIIAHLEPDRPVFGLRLPPLGEAGLGMAVLADHMAATLQAAAPNEAHCLMGHSFAGLLAYETACALERLGARVGVVALIDTGVPPGPAKTRVIRLLKGLRNSLRRLAGRPVPAASADVLECPGYASFDLRRHSDAHRQIIASLYDTMTSYYPGPFGGPLLLIRGDSRASFGRSDLGWTRHVKGGVETCWVAGGHLELVRNDACARQVAHAIERAMGDMGTKGGMGSDRFF